VKLGRNDLCHCGSGKKYKHCCMVTGTIGANAPADLVWRKLRGLLEGYGERILRFIDQAYGASALDEAWAEFVVGHDIEFDPESPTLQLFMPWFFHFWSPDVDTEVEDEALHGVAPTAAYLVRHGSQLDPLLRRYLESCLSTPLTFFEVTKAVPGQRILLRDILSGAQHDVTERAASRTMQYGDIVFGQLARVERLTMLEASNGFAIAPTEKAAIVDLRAQIAKANPVLTDEVLRDYYLEMLEVFQDIAERAFNPQLPTLQNTDGEPLSMRKLIYELKVPPQTAFDALKHLALSEPDEQLLADAERDSRGALASVTIVWKRPGNAKHPDWETTSMGTIAIEPGRLSAEVNSEARADAAAKAIDAALGEGVEFRVTQVQSMEKLIADSRAKAAAGIAIEPKPNPLAELPEVKQKVAEMLAAHWDRWVDQTLPALSGRTPMQAVQDPDGREIVESLLVQAERYGRAMNPPTDEAVFRRVRERLGLPSRG
jgi:hypothetical protein